jgi:hypothetical protein
MCHSRLEIANELIQRRSSVKAVGILIEGRWRWSRVWTCCQVVAVIALSGFHELGEFPFVRESPARHDVATVRPE